VYSPFLTFGDKPLTVKKCCIGTTLTDDEVIIASSLKQFALFLTAMETEMSLILEHANQKFIQPLDKFGKEHIGQFFGPKWHSPIGSMPFFFTGPIPPLQCG
jgi:hypothetical protein